jgi:hypothetical protein
MVCIFLFPLFLKINRNARLSFLEEAINNSFPIMSLMCRVQKLCRWMMETARWSRLLYRSLVGDVQRSDCCLAFNSRPAVKLVREVGKKP